MLMLQSIMTLGIFGVLWQENKTATNLACQQIHLTTEQTPYDEDCDIV